jgi:hypothetical protein
MALKKNIIKGIIQRIVMGVKTKLKRSVLVNWRLTSFYSILNFKATPSKEELKTIFRVLRITKMALSGQSDSGGFLSLRIP